MPQKAMGTTLSCTVDGQTKLIGCLRSIGEIKADSDVIDVTTLDAPDGYKTYMQGYKDLGEMTAEGFFDAANAGQAALRALYQSGSAVPFTVSFPDGSAAAFTAFVKSISLGAASVDGAVGFSATLRLTGGVTVS